MDLSADGSCPDVRKAECPTRHHTVDGLPLLLIAIDGFRPDYLDDKLIPTLKKLMDCGVNAPHMRPVYPSTTYPNLYTMVTGLYPESHGIIDGEMVDLELNETFSAYRSTLLSHAWWQGQPIWNTAVKHNKTTVAMYWPGGEAPVQGIRPTKYYIDSRTDEEPDELKLDKALRWLNGSEGVVADFVALNFRWLDNVGHRAGPDSLQVDRALVKVEYLTRRLMDSLYRQRLHKCVNIILVSDAGLSPVSASRTVTLADYLDDSTMQRITAYTGPGGRISNVYRQSHRSRSGYDVIPEDQRVEKSEILDQLRCGSPWVHVFKKSELPRRLHYAYNNRIDDIVLMPQDTWLLTRSRHWSRLKGQHGWDPSYENMQALFVGYGPSFKTGKTVEPFESIELYNLMSRLMNINPAPNNGTEGSLYPVLRHPPAFPAVPASHPLQCLFPHLDDEYQQRANVSFSGCSCGNATVRDWDLQLNISVEERLQLRHQHVRSGIPVSHRTFCILHQTDFLTAYSPSLKTPLWTAFLLDNHQANVSQESGCLRPDVRLNSSSQPQCGDLPQRAAPDDITPAYLFPPEFSSSNVTVTDTLILSNVVAMYQGFKTGIWSDLMQLIHEWTEAAVSMQVIVGPVFDYDMDGRMDENITRFVENSTVPVPSHYFLVALRCGTLNCTDATYHQQAFILPHVSNVTNCMSSRTYLADNLARIRDIELLTGLQFLTDIDTGEAVLTRTQIPQALWPV
ncbi:hypothetical protein NP493_196g03063 [Ridgeia piscesae]|uniref:Uncharacterized protein n=1 Tax=Ridgeia piscesae TaxID=27915 RepID=A0AAD9UEN2_RIDPI|nr:hypothetical protein NP493_196g03063 [Ridgeia piscesae]